MSSVISTPALAITCEMSRIVA